MKILLASTSTSDSYILKCIVSLLSVHVHNPDFDMAIFVPDLNINNEYLKLLNNYNIKLIEMKHDRVFEIIKTPPYPLICFNIFRIYQWAKNYDFVITIDGDICGYSTVPRSWFGDYIVSGSMIKRPWSNKTLQSGILCFNIKNCLHVDFYAEIVKFFKQSTGIRGDDFLIGKFVHSKKWNFNFNSWQYLYPYSSQNTICTHLFRKFHPWSQECLQNLHNFPLTLQSSILYWILLAQKYLGNLFISELAVCHSFISNYNNQIKLDILECNFHPLQIELLFKILTKNNHKKEMNYLIIEFGKSCGGLGDRIVGLTSAIILAKYLNKVLKIKWLHPNITSIIDIQHAWTGPLPSNIETINTIDNRFKYHSLLTTGKDIWHNKNILLKCNQNIAEFIYENPYYQTGNYLNEMRQCYRQIFSHYLIPKIYKNIEQFDAGFQIRTGDVYMGVGTYQPIKNITLLVETLGKFIKPTWENIYISSDYKNILTIFKSKFPHLNFFENQSSKFHLERSKSNDNDTSALIHDLLTLSTCKNLIISNYSNYGKLVFILSNHETCWGFEKTNFNPHIVVVDKYLFSKHCELPYAQKSIPSQSKLLKYTFHNQKLKSKSKPTLTLNQTSILVTMPKPILNPTSKSILKKYNSRNKALNK